MTTPPLSPLDKYVTTKRGRAHWAILGYPAGFTEAQQKRAARTHAKMTERDWAHQQICVQMGCGEALSSEDIKSNASLCLRDCSPKDWQDGSCVRLQLEDTDSLIQELLALGLIARVPRPPATEPTRAPSPQGKSSIRHLDHALAALVMIGALVALWRAIKHLV
jgi:hypothetical protein